MLYFLFGYDTYRLQKKLQEIEQKYVEKYGSILSLEKFNAGQPDEKDFWDSFSQNSLFVYKKLLILENVFGNEVFKKSFIKRIKELAQSSHIVVVVEKNEIKKTDSLFLALKRNGKTQGFSLLAGSELKKWAKRSFEKNGSEIEETALQKLLEYVGHDVWRLANEIQKLSSFKELIKIQDVDLMVKPIAEAEIFKTIDKFASKNKQQAFSALQKHLDLGESPIHLLSMLAYQARTLLLVKASQDSKDFTAKKTGLHPFVLRKSLGFARHFSLEQLKKMLQEIFEADLKIKTGQDNPEQALKMMVANIAAR